MAPQIAFDVRTAAIERELALLSRPQQYASALAPALNKVGARLQTEVDRAVRAVFQIRRDQVRPSIVLVRARVGGAIAGGGMQAVLHVFGSPSKRGRSMNPFRAVILSSAAARDKSQHAENCERGAGRLRNLNHVEASAFVVADDEEGVAGQAGDQQAEPDRQGALGEG